MIVIRELLESDFRQNVIEIFFEIDEQWAEVAPLIELLSTHGFKSFRQVGKGRHYDVLASKKSL